jgi:UDP-glucose 4-epimerase
LINAAINHAVECVVFASSIAVYGSGPDLALREESDYIIVRPHKIYGERQNIGDKYRTWWLSS